MTDTIKTWQERAIKNAGWYDMKKAMQAEIDELRAALAQQAEPVGEPEKLNHTTQLQVAYVMGLRDAKSAHQAEPVGEPACIEPSFEQRKQILNGLTHCHSSDSRHEFLRVWIRDWTCHKVSKAQQPAMEPVGWEWRWFDANPNTVTFGQWSEWKRVEPRNRLCTVEDSLNEFRAYIANGSRYELRALFTSPPPAEHSCKFPACQTEAYQQMLSAQVARDLFAAPVVADDVLKDALRYRFLRDRSWWDTTVCVVADPKNSVKLGAFCPSHELLDAAIDTAMGGAA